MAELFDIYVLSNKRNPRDIMQFLNKYMSDRVEVADEYLFPQFSEKPKHKFLKANDLINFICINKLESHAIYWSSRTNSTLRHIMIFPTKDGKIIFGLSVESDELDHLNGLKDYLGSDLGYITYESPPPENSKDFSKEVDGYERRKA